MKIVFQSFGEFTHICIGTAKQVVCLHLLVRRSVAVEVVHEDALEAVAAEDGVGLVDNLQGVELCTAFRVMRSGAGKDDEEEEDGTPSPHPVSLKVAGCARYADVWLFRFMTQRYEEK